MHNVHPGVNPSMDTFLEISRVRATLYLQMRLTKPHEPRTTNPHPSIPQAPPPRLRALGPKATPVKQRLEVCRVPDSGE